MPSNGTLDEGDPQSARGRVERGLRVALVECRDLAAGTSSRSSKLIHGGLRYLEQRDFRLVWEALRERRKDAVGGGDARAPAVRAARRRPGRAACREGRLRRRAGRPGCPT